MVHYFSRLNSSLESYIFGCFRPKRNEPIVYCWMWCHSEVENSWSMEKSETDVVKANSKAWVRGVSHRWGNTSSLPASLALVSDHWLRTQLRSQCSIVGIVFAMLALSCFRSTLTQYIINANQSLLSTYFRPKFSAKSRKTGIMAGIMVSYEWIIRPNNEVMQRTGGRRQWLRVVSARPVITTLTIDLRLFWCEAWLEFGHQWGVN